MSKRRIAAMLAMAVATPPAHAALYEARSDHFVVYAQGASPDIVRDKARELERFDKGMRRLRALPDDPTARANPLTVFVLASMQAVQGLCASGRHARGGCTNVAGFYNGRAQGSIAVVPQTRTAGTYDLSSRTVLFHEYAHHIMFQYFTAAYPAWVVEGFAEFNSTAEPASDGTLGFGRPALHRAAGLMLGGTMPIERLLTARGPELEPEQRELLYGRGWLLYHYLTFEPERAGQLATYLQAVSRGTPSLTAARAAFGDLHALNVALDHYVRSRRLSYLALSADATVPGPATVRMLGPGEAALLPVRMRSMRGVDGETVQEVARDARRLAAPFPDDAGAQDALAEAEADAGDAAAAIAAAARALKARPDDRVAMLRMAAALEARALLGGHKDAGTWTEVRSWLLKANKAEPDWADPLQRYYRTFLAQGVRPTANAVAALEQAQALVPQDDDVRLLLARQWLADRRPQDARALLVPIAYGPHAPADNVAARIIASIDAGRPAGTENAAPEGDGAALPGR